LVEDFVARGDEAAFEVLVWRHGAMVLRLCQRVLRDSHEAEDAFQATFLVFARKARAIGKGASVGSWLYKVAYRVALRLRGRRALRGAEALGRARRESEEGAGYFSGDLRPVLDEEIRRLPEKYRAPFVLCYLESHTNEEAAEQLGCPRGTVLSRLARGRERLRWRLARRGVCLAAVLTCAAPAPAALVESTVKAAIPSAARNGLAGLVPASVAALTEGALHAMSLTKLKVAGTALLALAVLGPAVGLVGPRAGAERPADRPAVVAPARPPAKEAVKASREEER